MSDHDGRVSDHDCVSDHGRVSDHDCVIGHGHDDDHHHHDYVHARVYDSNPNQKAYCYL